MDDVRANSVDAHVENFSDYRVRVDELLARSKRARKHGASLRDSAERLTNEANHYAAHFGLGNRIPVSSDTPVTAAEPAAEPVPPLLDTGPLPERLITETTPPPRYRVIALGSTMGWYVQDIEARKRVSPAEGYWAAEARAHAECARLEMQP